MQNPPPGPQGPHESPTGPMHPQQHTTQPVYPPQYPPQYLPQYPPQSVYPTQPGYPPPQQPLYPSLYPAPVPQNVYFQNQSFTTKAVIAFLLYWLGYIPGLIFNIMFLVEAHRIQGETGRTPSGYGCLWATLIGSLIPAVLLLMFILFIVAVIASNGGTTMY